MQGEVLIIWDFKIESREKLEGRETLLCLKLGKSSLFPEASTGLKAYGLRPIGRKQSISCDQMVET